MAELTEETIEIPQVLRYYIDYEAMARDAALKCELFAVETGLNEVHVFGGG